MKNNESAFPIPSKAFASGLTKRELIAAMIMQGFLAYPDRVGADLIVVHSVEYADRLLYQLSLEQQ